jgi:hypothetical protein
MIKTSGVIRIARGIFADSFDDPILSIAHMLASQAMLI